MESIFNSDEKTLILKFKNEIDDCSIQKMRGKVDYEIKRYIPKKVVLDFYSVSFMDSAGIGFIIGRYKFLRMIGGTLEVANLSDSVKKILEMSGILNLVKITDLNENIA